MFEEYTHEFYRNHFVKISRGKTRISLDDIAEALEIKQPDAVRFLRFYIENGYLAANAFGGAHPILPGTVIRSTYADYLKNISCLELEIFMILTQRDEEMSFSDIASEIEYSMLPCFYGFCKKFGRGYSSNDIEIITM